MSEHHQEPVHPIISAHRVEGSSVFNFEGERIGKIEDILIEKVSGQITSAVLCYGGPLSQGGGRYPIPWSSLSYDVDLKGYVLDEARLKTAPALPAAGWRGSDLPWREGVYDHWAAPPYWFGPGPRPQPQRRRPKAGEGPHDPGHH